MRIASLPTFSLSLSLLLSHSSWMIVNDGSRDDGDGDDGSDGDVDNTLSFCLFFLFAVSLFHSYIHTHRHTHTHTHNIEDKLKRERERARSEEWIKKRVWMEGDRGSKWNTGQTLTNEGKGKEERREGEGEREIKDCILSTFIQPFPFDQICNYGDCWTTLGSLK